MNSQPQTVINSTDFLHAQNMPQQQIMARIGRWVNLKEVHGYIIDSVNEHYINVVNIKVNIEVYGLYRR